ncbi:MAG: conserved rane protein of unknown function [Clostridia bacterium]|jgi:hypothetical protein|nr:conserved rane protein of unknown function [Clostridia bacterium]
MWFDEIMDDCKKALVVANKHKSIFVPIFLKAALVIVIGIYVFTGLFLSIFKHQYDFEYLFTDFSTIVEILPTFIGFGLILYLLILVGFSILDVGSINMFRAALDDTKPGFSHFMEGIKKYLLKVMLGKFIYHLVVLIASPLLLLIYMLYAIIVGTLTGGWGIMFLGALISVYLGTWVTIAVLEGYSPFKAIGKSFMLGTKYFKGLFVILIASTLIAAYSAGMFGILPAVVAGWFIAGVVATYFKLVIIQIYYRNKERI